MPDQSEFITHFEVSNFKKFDHLVVEDIGQFNLITGDNNVGKTTLLDLLTLNLSNFSKMIFLLHYDLCQRGIHYHFDTKLSNHILPEGVDKSLPKYNYFEEFTKIDNPLVLFYEKNDSDRKIRIELKKLVHLYNTEEFLQANRYKGIVELDLSDYIIQIYENDKLVNTQFLYQDDIDKAALKHAENIEFRYVPIVKFKHFYSKEVADMYENISANGQEEVLQNSRNIAIIVNFMKFILPDIKGIGLDEKRGLIFVNRTSNGENPEYITKFGDGVQKALRYIVELLYSKSKNYNYFCIDEIDTGIHFSRLKEFWINLISICKEFDIQLYTTTHSQECIEAYAQALKELNMEEKGRLITLKEKDGIIFANTKNHEVFSYGLENGYNGLG
jgi:AAA15 family ATPase/GTPase